MGSGRAQAIVQEGEERLWGKGNKRKFIDGKRSGDMVLFLFLTMGSCEFLRRIILGLRPGCFMLHWCLSFPFSYLNPSDIICNYFKKAEAQGSVLGEWL